MSFTINTLFGFSHCLLWWLWSFVVGYCHVTLSYYSPQMTHKHIHHGCKSKFQKAILVCLKLVRYFYLYVGVVCTNKDFNVIHQNPKKILFGSDKHRRKHLLSRLFEVFRSRAFPRTKPNLSSVLHPLVANSCCQVGIKDVSRLSWNSPICHL